MSKTDFCNRLCALASGVCAIIAIYEKLDELEGDKSAVKGLAYIVNHLYNDIETLRTELEPGIAMERLPVHPAPSGGACRVRMRHMDR